MSEMLAWRFLTKNQRLGMLLPDGSNALVVPGKIFYEERAGEHKRLYGWERVFDALRHASSPTVCRVILGGKIEPERKHRNRITTTKLTVLWVGDATRAIQQFGLDIAERILWIEREANREPSQALWNVLAAKRAWLDGAITDQECKRANDDMEEALNWLGGLAWLANVLQVNPDERLRNSFVKMQEEGGPETKSSSALRQMQYEEILAANMAAKVVGDVARLDVKNILKSDLPALLSLTAYRSGRSRKQFVEQFNAELAILNAELERRLTEAFGDTTSG